MITISTTTITQISTIYIMITWIISILIKQYHNQVYTLEGHIADDVLRTLKSNCIDICDNTVEFELEPILIEYEII